jgi:hypothetical protein
MRSAADGPFMPLHALPAPFPAAVAHSAGGHEGTVTTEIPVEGLLPSRPATKRGIRIVDRAAARCFLSRRDDLGGNDTAKGASSLFPTPRPRHEAAVITVDAHSEVVVVLGAPGRDAGAGRIIHLE